MANKTQIIALTGKGGVGKTSISATIVKLLVKHFPDKKILAIDADPAVGLSAVLNIDVQKTIDDIRKELIKNLKDDDNKSVTEFLGEAKFKLYEGISEQNGFAFIAIGRPEAEGCYCRINEYLKEVITILSSQFDYVVIDGEAGIEQVNRRVMEKVTHLLLVTDASRKGCQVIQTIKQVADELVMYEKIGVIANRLPSKDLVSQMDFGQIPLLSAIPSDDNLAICDMKGENVFFLDDNSNIVKGTEEALKNMGIL